MLRLQNQISRHVFRTRQRDEETIRLESREKRVLRASPQRVPIVGNPGLWMPSIRPPREKAIIIASGTVSNIPRLGQAWSPASAASPGRRLEGLPLEQRIFRRVIFGLHRIYRAARLARVEFAGIGGGASRISKLSLKKLTTRDF